MHRAAVAAKATTAGTSEDARPAVDVLRVVEDHVVLAAVLAQAGDDSVGNLALVDRDADELVGRPAHVVALRGVKRLEAQLDALLLPTLEHGLRYGSVQEPTEGQPFCPGDPGERGVGRRTDSDVVGVVEDAVGAERVHDGQLFTVRTAATASTSSGKGTCSTPPSA